MPDQPFKLISCPVLVLRIEPAQLLGDALAESLREELLKARQLVDARNVVVDFQPVTYLSSASFRPLLSLLREIRGLGGRMVLCNLHRDVHEVFSVTRLIRTHPDIPAAFEVQPDVPAAIVSLLNSANPSA